MPKFKVGDEVVIRKGEALPVDPSVAKMEAASQRYTGDMDGCKGIVCAPVFEREGYAGPHPGVEKVTIAPTDYSKDGRPTGLVDVPVSRIRHTSFRRRVAEGVADVARTVVGGYSARGRSNYEASFGTDAERAEMKRTGKTLAQVRGRPEPAGFDFAGRN
jgi:hypothetical protein